MAVSDLPPEYCLTVHGSSSTHFGRVCKSAADACGVLEGGICLQVGDPDWGAIHIGDRHGEEIAAAQYEYIELFVQDIASNYLFIHEGRSGRIELLMPGYKSEVKTASSSVDRLMVIQYDEAGGFWTVVTCYTIRRNKKIKGRLLWRRSEPAISSP